MNELVNTENTTSDQPEPRWFIDFDWLEQHDRSLSVLAEGSLCPKCRERLKESGEKMVAADLISSVKDCCGQATEFITGQLPVLESIFRLFLANGNQPLDLDELGKQLNERRGGDTYRASAEILSRLLSNDRFYGLRQVQD